ncbi:hypothetical protein F2Q69_00006918 [Brassica cretica]|uniref:Uncharacterized protein n=1 Tax=Brassica cretica TaxID=69181 RepID=A0A8S9P241_BRACR|nr:hypothetical protein F2Q69_00006918 [Brassica cretica]
MRGVAPSLITEVGRFIKRNVFFEITLAAVPVSMMILEKVVPASSNVMTKAFSWGISSLTVSCSWKVVVSAFCVAPSGSTCFWEVVFCPIGLWVAPFDSVGFPDLEGSRLIDSMRSNRVQVGFIVALRNLRSVS